MPSFIVLALVFMVVSFAAPQLVVVWILRSRGKDLSRTATRACAHAILGGTTVAGCALVVAVIGVFVAPVRVGDQVGVVVDAVICIVAGIIAVRWGRDMLGASAARS